MIELKNIIKIHNLDEVKVTALNDVSLRCDKGEIVSIMGPSGSSHEEDTAAYTQRTIYLRDGKIVEEKKR